MSCFGSVYVSTHIKKETETYGDMLYNLLSFVNAGPDTSTDVRLLGDHLVNNEPALV